MFELPEYITLACQFNDTLTGKVVANGGLGNSPHKFVWYNRTPEEFTELVAGKRIGEARAKGKWLIVSLDPGYVLLFGECGGRLQHHVAGSAMPQKYHLWLAFDDGSLLTAMTAMWGAMELYEAGQEQERQYLKGMRTTPVDPDFTFDYFAELVDGLLLGEKRSAKALLTQEQLIPGLGNAISQDILFRAGLSPKHPLRELDASQRRALYDAIISTVGDVIAKGGRNDEVDLYGRAGGYTRVMDSKAAGNPCPACGTRVEKIQYLGGACYFCPRCQI